MKEIIENDTTGKSDEKAVQNAAEDAGHADEESQCAVRPEEHGEEMVQLGLDSCGD